MAKDSTWIWIGAIIIGILIVSQINFSGLQSIVDPVIINTFFPDFDKVDPSITTCTTNYIGDGSYLGSNTYANWDGTTPSGSFLRIVYSNTYCSDLQNYCIGSYIPDGLDNKIMIGMRGDDISLTPWCMIHYMSNPINYDISNTWLNQTPEYRCEGTMRQQIKYRVIDYYRDYSGDWKGYKWLNYPCTEGYTCDNLNETYCSASVSTATGLDTIYVERIEDIPHLKAGESSDITYKVRGLAGITQDWAITIEEWVTGDCVFSSGSNKYQTIILSDSGITEKTISVIASTTAVDLTTCSLYGNYQVVDLPIVDFEDVGTKICLLKNTRADINPCDGCVKRNELSSFIPKWMRGEETRIELGGAIASWLVC